MTIHIDRNMLVVVGLVAACAIALAMLFSVPLGSILWIGLILACPLMMLFMMHGHGDAGHADHGRPGNDEYPRGVH